MKSLTSVWATRLSIAQGNGQASECLRTWFMPIFKSIEN